MTLTSREVKTKNDEERPLEVDEVQSNEETSREAR